MVVLLYTYFITIRNYFELIVFYVDGIKFLAVVCIPLKSFISGCVPEKGN